MAIITSLRNAKSKSTQPYTGVDFAVPARDPGRLTIDHHDHLTIDRLTAYDHATRSLPTLYATMLVPTSMRFTASVVTQWAMVNISPHMYCSTLELTFLVRQ